ncbi:hypothetical protein J3R74_000640 [Puniceicoccus vermicola]|nr:hypothetical protein [Puniceicoccus vermicola]
MMNLETWKHFSSRTQKHEAAQSISDREFDSLNPGERSMVEMLRENSGLRLEQEHIDFEYIKVVFRSCFNLIGMTQGHR